MAQGDSAGRALLSADTSAAAERLQVDRWREMSPLQKARAVAELSRSVRELSLTGFRRRFPQASEAELRLRLAILTLGRATACRLFPEASSLSER